jgi:hypothetical protein
LLAGDFLDFIFVNDVSVLLFELIRLIAQEDGIFNEFIGGFLSQINESFEFGDGHWGEGDFGMSLFGDESNAVIVFVLVGLDEILRVDVNVAAWPKQKALGLLYSDPQR